MKFSLNRGSAILLSLLLLCASCGDVDLFDTDKWSDKIEGWEPGVKGAIAHGEFTLWDLLKDESDSDSPIHKEPIEAGSKDSILVIKYTEENIYNISVSKVFELGTKDIIFDKTFDIPESLKEHDNGIDIETVFPQGHNINDDIEAEIPFPEEFAGTSLNQIKLSKGTCIYLLPLLDDVNYTVKVTYLSGGEVKPLLESSNLEAGQYKELSLNGKTFDLVDNKIKLNFAITLVDGHYNDADFMVYVKFCDYDFDRIEGKIVKAGGIAIENEEKPNEKLSFDMDIDFLNDIGGNFKFADPKLELVVRNKGIGLPVSVNMDFEGQDKDGTPGTMELNEPLIFGGNPSNDVVKTIPKEINKDNSTIVDFLSLPPQGDIFYSGKVNLNPGGENNVIYKNGSMDMDVNISIPLSLTDSLSYRETLEDIDIDQKYADKIKEGTISINVLENGLPMDLSVPKLILMTENETPIDTISVLTSTGDAQIKANKNGTLIFKINQKQAKNLGQTEKILLEAVLFSETATPVRSDAKLKFALILEAKAVITDLDDF